MLKKIFMGGADAYKIILAILGESTEKDVCISG